MIAVQKDPAAPPSRIVCYAEPAEEMSTLTSPLEGFDVVRAEDERQIREALREANVLVLAVRGELSKAWRAMVARLRRAFPSVAFVLVTEREPTAAEWMVGLSFEALVWREQAAEDLEGGLARARASAAFEQMARAIESSDLPRGLRRALALALRRTLEDPFPTLQALADAVTHQLVTLRQEFAAHAPEGYTLGDFLSALHVLHAVHLRHTGLSWQAVAHSLGFTRRTLRRKATAWPKSGLKDLEALDPRHLLRHFVDEHLAPLLGGPPHPPRV